ncbi:flagellar protein FlaG [Pseudomonas sp. EpS/L25]|uniref:flagellar protein FlaG n=1 Tax=Pseudomonas sp. EpS/L25 TaxID=1749078 RepID=UPI0008029474|nr:flagellar protein FlaG [Pseudomonas sp. EpS/L25]
MDIVKITGFAAATPYGAQSGSQAATAVTPPASVSPSASSEDAKVGQAEKEKADKPEDGNVDDALSKLKTKFQEDHRNLDFSIDDSTGEVVVKVLDGESGKLIRQMPSEEVLKLAKQLDDMRSLMFKAEA